MNTIGKEAVYSVERFFEYEPHTTTRDKMSNELLDTQRNVWHKLYGARGAGLWSGLYDSTGLATLS